MKLAIIGLGSIGASVGLACQHESLGDTVIGYDSDPNALEGALAMSAIDQPAESVAACAEADLIVVATPPNAVPEVFQQLAPQLRPHTVITDVVSVKQPVLAWAQQYLPYPTRFVGGHPIAGTEQRGYTAARADLFQGAQWALTPTPYTDADALAQVGQFVRTLRAAPILIDPLQHDREFALLSFVPHCVAFSLVALHRQHPTLLQGGGSWRSATRVAHSDPTLWHQLLLLNREATAEWLRQLIEHLEQFRTALDQDDLEALRTLM